jgi:hypothetical protein
MLIEPEFLAGMAAGAGTVVGLGWVGAVVGGAVRLAARTAFRTGYMAIELSRLEKSRLKRHQVFRMYLPKRVPSKRQNSRFNRRFNRRISFGAPTAGHSTFPG